MTIETIRKGIIDKDWDLVTSAFNDISKVFNIEPIVSKKTLGRPKKQKPQENRTLIDIPETDEEISEEVEEIKTRKRRSVFINKWKDTGKLCTEDRIIDRKLAVAKPVDRVRKDPTRKIGCQACGKVVEAHSSLIFDKDSYTCPKCIPQGK